MLRRALLAAGLILTSLAAAVQAEPLGVGDPAPRLAVKEFVKGKPIKEFARGKTYVVEFWATWCGPCRQSIPHLTELAKKYRKEVTFVGVSVWENDQSKVKPFVAEMGEKMGYTVAMDAVAANDKPDEGTMAQTWMRAAAQNGIPAAFIVNGDGKIAWIGHPMQIDQALGQVVVGKWDLAKASAEFKKASENERKLMAIDQALRKAMRANDPKQVLEVIDRAIAEDPGLEARLAALKFNTLLKMGDQAAAAAYAEQLIAGPAGQNAMQLNQIAWTIVDPEAKTKPEAALVAVALKAAQKADELAAGKDPAIADTLAAAYFASGDAVKALEVQERAVKLAVGTEFEKDPSLKQRLEEYRKAVASKP